MSRVLPILLLTALLPLRAGAQAPDVAPFYSVSYIEVKPSARSTALAALKQYRDVGQKDSRNIGLELFEEADRAGHFVLIETWQDEAAFNTLGAFRKQLADAIAPLRVSDWDTRPYKTLTVASGAIEANVHSVYVITHVDVSPDPKVAAMLKTLAEASRLEDGNVRFDVLQHTMRANHFTVIETWQSAKAYEAHTAAGPTRKYRDALQPFLGSPLDERIFKAVE